MSRLGSLENNLFSIMKLLWFTVCIFNSYLTHLFGAGEELFQGSFVMNQKKDKIIVTLSNSSDTSYVVKFVGGMLPYQIGYSDNLNLGRFINTKMGFTSYVFMEPKVGGGLSQRYHLSLPNDKELTVPEFVVVTVNCLSQESFFKFESIDSAQKSFKPIKVICKKK